MSDSSKTMTALSRLAIIIAILSALALVGTLVFYFQEMAIPTLLMLFARLGLPTAFILAAIVVFGNVARRRKS
ncbi:polyferredoxin [Arthrobacter sp. JUb119]|nr:polyferredoxin [Arthrobacter sp. JUb119]